MKNKKRHSSSDIFIDESKHRTAPTFFQRIRNTLAAVGMGIIFAQVLLFAFKFFVVSSVVYYFWFYPLLSIAYLIVCAVLGWIYGDKFIQTLSKESANWWNLWGYWR
ncbi:MAG TPA: hypothetical protein VF181_03990 [Balneolaceae bacterium]